MKFRLPVLLLCLLLLITGCRESAQPTADASDIEMTLTVDPNPPKVGEATLLITLTNSAGQAVEAQSLTARGDMTHAGMMPEMGGEAVKTDTGYSIPLTWSMGGDWIITVEATLADGRKVSQEFNLSVES